MCLNIKESEHIKRNYTYNKETGNKWRMLWLINGFVQKKLRHKIWWIGVLFSDKYRQTIKKNPIHLYYQKFKKIKYMYSVTTFLKGFTNTSERVCRRNIDVIKIFVSFNDCHK